MSEVKKLKVLIVDDENEIASLIKELLSPFYDGLIATSGPEALDHLDKSGSVTACVVSDYKMPGMTGIQLRQAMQEKHKDVPFILLSGYITKEDAQAGADASVSAMLPKPFEAPTLIDLVKKTSKDREAGIRERLALEQIFIEESGAILEELEPLIMALEQRPNDAETINTIFRLIHTIKGSSGVLETSHVRVYVHKFEDLLTKLKNNTVDVTPEIVSLLLKGYDTVSKMINCLKTGEAWNQDELILARIFDLTSKNQSTDAGKASSVDALAANKPDSTKESVSVPTVMLDEFMELSGEITVIRNMVNKLVRVIEKETPSNKNVLHLGELLEEMHKINSGIQGRLIETRKVPLSKVFRPLPRAVRDTAQNLGKSIDFRVEGDHIRVDSSLAQVLSDSLIHIVRNSIDHGIETRELRSQRRKKPEGSLTIRAMEKGDEVVVSIQDDGGGLDASKIKKKAIERGLFSPAEADKLSTQKIYALIFESGFSTASQVTDVSGRGVGMDMVRASVQKVKGRVDIESDQGKGTTFSLHLPIPKSVLIINSLVVETCGRDFAIPQDSIARLLRLEGGRLRQCVKRLEGAYVLDFEGELMPLTDLGESLGLRRKSDIDYLSLDTLNILITRTDASHYALSVDRVLDSEEIVVKTVGKHMERLKVYAGATFMGDGSVGLVLSVDGIAEVAGVTSPTIQLQSSVELAKDTPVGDVKELLVFNLWCPGVFAVPLSVVHRLEEISPNSIQGVGDRHVVIYRDQVMPVIDLTHALGMSSRKQNWQESEVRVPMVVSMINDRYVGFAIRSIRDVCSTAEDIDSLIRDRASIKGSVDLNGTVVSLLDIDPILEAQGIFKSLDPTGALTRFAHGPKSNQPSEEVIKPEAAVQENTAVSGESTSFNGDGWGLF